MHAEVILEYIYIEEENESCGVYTYRLSIQSCVHAGWIDIEVCIYISSCQYNPAGVYIRAGWYREVYIEKQKNSGVQIEVGVVQIYMYRVFEYIQIWGIYESILYMYIDACI